MKFDFLKAASEIVGIMSGLGSLYILSHKIKQFWGKRRTASTKSRLHNPKEEER